MQLWSWSFKRIKSKSFRSYTEMKSLDTGRIWSAALSGVIFVCGDVVDESGAAWLVRFASHTVVLELSSQSRCSSGRRPQVSNPSSLMDSGCLSSTADGGTQGLDLWVGGSVGVRDEYGDRAAGGE